MVVYGWLSTGWLMLFNLPTIFCSSDHSLCSLLIIYCYFIEEFTVFLSGADQHKFNDLKFVLLTSEVKH